MYIALLFAARLPCLPYNGESSAGVHAPCRGPWVLGQAAVLRTVSAPQLMGETKVVCGGYVVWCALSSIPPGSGRKLARSKLFCHGKHAACTQLVRCISLDCGAAAVSILFEECGHG